MSKEKVWGNELKKLPFTLNHEFESVISKQNKGFTGVSLRNEEKL